MRWSAMIVEPHMGGYMIEIRQWDTADFGSNLMLKYLTPVPAFLLIRSILVSIYPPLLWKLATYSIGCTRFITSLQCKFNCRLFYWKSLYLSMVLKTSYNRKIATKELFLQNNHVYDSPLLRCISNLREKKNLPPQSHKLKQSLTFSIGCSFQNSLSESRVKRVDLWMHTRNTNVFNQQNSCWSSSYCDRKVWIQGLSHKAIKTNFSFLLIAFT